MNPRSLSVYISTSPALQDVEWHTASLFARMGWGYAMPRRRHIEAMSEETLVLVLKTRDITYTERALVVCRLRRLRRMRMANARRG